jgi:GNAT superfamily N-acetyltransferase
MIQTQALTFRLAGPADHAALKALVELAYRGENARAGWTHEADLLEGERIDADELAHILASGSPRLIVAAGEAGRLIGCVAVTDLGAGASGVQSDIHRAYLGMLCVDPTRQAGGLGRRLIAQAEALARDTFGATAMEMTVIERRAELIAWYERCGYARTGEQRAFPIEDVDLPMAVLERALT